ncbi:hypothetical protein [Prosthecomicrobium sp. N25]|uniref:hypothetical protein n=1 Tax=Prosthecomicrobium sp. N25 TaxID=3129254 RepID=UPI0030786478
MKIMVAIAAAALVATSFTASPSFAGKGQGLEAAKEQLVLRGGKGGGGGKTGGKGRGGADDTGTDDHGVHGPGHP